MFEYTKKRFTALWTTAFRSSPNERKVTIFLGCNRGHSGVVLGVCNISDYFVLRLENGTTAYAPQSWVE